MFFRSFFRTGKLKHAPTTRYTVVWEQASVATIASTASDNASNRRFEGLAPEQLIRAFRLMHTARRLDDREVTLKRQNRIFFQISSFLKFVAPKTASIKILR